MVNNGQTGVVKRVCKLLSAFGVTLSQVLTDVWARVTTF